MSIFTKFSTVKKVVVAALLMTSFGASAAIDMYEVGDMGFIRTPMESANGIIVTNNRYSEIYTLKNNTLTPILRANNCGLYTNLSKDGKYLGFKSFDSQDQQAPAILDVTTGAVTILEDYVWECGQVSFANDGTMAYTMGNSLIIRKGNTRKAFDLGFYTNIANISPDGTQVVYSNVFEGRSYIINTLTGAKEQINVNDGYRATWSPDGTKMAIQTGTGGVMIRENATKRVFNLGQAESVTWANNSTELIVTRYERKNEFEITSSAIKRVNFDGSNEITLVNSSNSLPVDAILTSDNQLVVPYKTGAKRGLAIKDLRAGITPMAASIADKSVVKLDNESVFGGRVSNPNDNPNIKPSPIPAEGTIGALDIEYLSQIYDSPAVNGCTSHGHVTCAPTSACMHLGYFGLLPKKATKNRYSGATKYYAHAISAVFTNLAGSKTFNETAYGNGCYSVPGGYGYMWTGSNSPGGGRMGTFYTLNGATSQTYTWSSATAWSWLSSEASAGRPTPLCIALDSSGHLILGFRSNCTYTTAGGFVTRTGSFVCHDPYGDDNDYTWADNDGQHSSYDWVGYNSGRANIGTFYWAIKVGIPASANPGTSTEVGVKCDPASIELTGEVGSTANIYKDVKVTGTGLTTDISVNSATSAITVEKLSGWNDRTGGTIRLKLNTNFSKGAGTYESYVAVQSTSSYRVQIATKVTLTDPAGATKTPTIGVSPSSASMSAKVGESATTSIAVTGTDLSANIAASLAGDAAFSIDNTSLGTSGGTIKVTYKPTAAGSHNATLTLSSTGATSKTVSISGTATAASTPSTPSTSYTVGLTKVWQNTSSVPGTAAGGDVRFAAVSGGKLLVNDKANNKILEVTASGSSNYYDPASVLSEYYGQVISTAIGCDDAGNFLVSTGFSGVASGKNFAVISADLKSTYKIDLSAIEGYTPARNDQVGRIRGNMLSNEGGYAFITPNGGTSVLVVKIKNGAVDTDYTQVSNPIAGVTLNTSCCPQPAFATVAEIDALMDDNGDLSSAFIMRSRGVPGSVFAWNDGNTDMVKAWTFGAAEGNCTTANASVEGFDWFTLKGKSYFIMPVTTDGTTGTRGSNFAIFDEEGTCVATWTEGQKAGLGAAMGSIIAVPNDDVSVYIYHFVPGTVAEKLIFAVDSTSGVENFETEDANAPVEYYNLQGVKVANPSNGIFIKVQGNKASKVLVK